MNDVDPDEPLVLNPEFMRVAGLHGIGSLPAGPVQLMRLDEAAFTLAGRFVTARLVREVIPNATDDERQLLSQLMALRVLLRATDPVRTSGLRLRPAAQRFANSASWPADGRVKGAFGILGIPWDRGTLPQFSRGASEGPSAIRAASQALPVRHDIGSGRMLGFFDADTSRHLLVGATVLDAGDLEAASSVNWSDAAAEISRVTGEMRSAGAIPVVLGGDHSLTLPALCGIDEPFGVLHLDAHTDMALVRFPGDVHHGNFMQHVVALPNVAHVLQLGHRGVVTDQPSADGCDYESWSVYALRGLSAPDRAALGKPALPYYVTIDIDALDPSTAPGTPAPVPDGFSVTEVRALLRQLIGKRRVLGIDLMEVLPREDRSTLTCQSAVQVLLEAMSCAERS